MQEAARTTRHHVQKTSHNLSVLHECLHEFIITQVKELTFSNPSPPPFFSFLFFLQPPHFQEVLAAY